MDAVHKISFGNNALCCGLRFANDGTKPVVVGQGLSNLPITESTSRLCDSVSVEYQDDVATESRLH